MPNPYAPDESHSTIVAEETWLQGVLLSNIAYGVELTLFVMCFYLLLRRASLENRRRTLSLLVFITSVFVMGTMYMVTNAIFTQMAFVENRNYPGGPSAYELNMVLLNVVLIGNVCFILSNWLMDLLLVWRCMVIYKGCGFFYWAVTTITSLLFVFSLVSGTLYLVLINGSSIWPDVALAYFCTTLALNIIATLLIVVRLFLQRRQMVGAVGLGHGSPYTSIIAMVVESAALYSIFMVLFIVPFALGSSLAQFFMQSMVQVQTVSSFLIIFRVAQGTAWTENTGIRTSGAVRDRQSRSPTKISNLIFAAPRSTLSLVVQRPNVSLEPADSDAESQRENMSVGQFGETADQSSMY